MTPRRAFALLLALLMLAGCAGGARADRPAELVWAVGKVTAEGPATVVRDAWNRAHPEGPKVRILALPQDADNQRSLLALELNAGIGDLDVFELDVPWTAEFAEKGWLVGLDGMRPDLERLSLPGPLATGEWDGTLWAAPFTTDAGLLYYRTDLVAGPPRSWPELVEVGNRVAAERGIAPFVSDGAPGEGLVVQYLEYLWAAGGELAVDGSDIRFDQGPAVKALTFMRDGYRTGFYAPGFDSTKLEDARQTFQSGQAVFMRSWPYAYRPMNNDPTSQVAGKVGIAPLPTFDGTGSVAGLGGHNLAINRYSAHADAAREFVRFATMDRDVQRGLAGRYSLVPALRAAHDDLASDPLMSLLATRLLPIGRPRPATPDWATISEELKQQVFAGYTGKIPPETAVATMRRFLEATARR
ncbi:ABC transporter substrate-binding protein [Pseudonocardia acaciae]|uniref:ABC transporter substrate-binding protein n=1 Tax=Pseudonocardia acaciae TaxID=551276 RepID=UPI000AA99017|nr:ABC transporter substrate-binding protein [Pseudonocardia acaciae]